MAVAKGVERAFQGVKKVNMHACELTLQRIYICAVIVKLCTIVNRSVFDCRYKG